MKWFVALSLPLLASCGTSNPAPPPTPLSASATAIDVPLKRLDDGYYAEINLGWGTTGLFLIDSGSDTSFVTVKGEKTVKAGGGRSNADGTLNVENAGLAGKPVALPELRLWGDKQDTMDPRSDGILGIDFLADYKCGFDFQAKRMRLWPKETDLRAEPAEWLDRSAGLPPGSSKPQGAYLLNLSPYEGVLLQTSMRYDGETVDSIVDTGASSSCVSGPRARALNWSYNEERATTAFFYGKADLRFHEVKSTGIGGIQMNGSRRLATVQNDDGVSLVGLDVLTSLTFLLDVSNRQMVIAWKHPSPNFRPSINGTP